jgi:hypothetical protein
MKNLTLEQLLVLLLFILAVAAALLSGVEAVSSLLTTMLCALSVNPGRWE